MTKNGPEALDVLELVNVAATEEEVKYLFVILPGQGIPFPKRHSGDDRKLGPSLLKS